MIKFNFYGKRRNVMDGFQIVVFKLGEEEYAMKISFAKEIIRIPALTKMPNTPEFLEGVFNLRGKAVPVFDLKKKFKLVNQREVLTVGY